MIDKVTHHYYDTHFLNNSKLKKKKTMTATAQKVRQEHSPGFELKHQEKLSM